MAPTAKKVSKPLFKTSSPFTETTCLLAPLGDHRRIHGQPSKGKKRKRTDKASSDEVPASSAPAIGSHVLVGLNSVTRHLERLAACSAPITSPVREADDVDKPVLTGQDGIEMPPDNALGLLSMVILTHPQPSLSPSHAHIPTLLHLAMLQTTPQTKVSEPTRLVVLKTSNDARFATAMHIPRVGAIGIYDGAPGAKAVEEYVRKHVGLTGCLWVDEAMTPAWRGLNVQQA